MLNSEVLVSLLTLSLLEVVLGIDNIVFISILSGKLPEEKQKLARRYGLFIGMIVRIGLLAAISIILKLDKPLFNVFDIGISGKDIIMMIGGLFLLYQSTREIHHKLEGESGDDSRELKQTKLMTFQAVMVQMFLLNIVFSIDSVITAVGMADHVWVMMAAVIVSVVVMLFAAEPISDFVHKHPTIKILALSFLLLIGVSLIAEGLHYHIPKGTIYFAMAFSFAVDIIQLRLNKTQQAPVNLHERYSDKDEKRDVDVL
ncbi:MAG TPA: TerC family protein [Chitinophagaceae bacterium]|nr:TerC family protein [Chitinophagaceae bacterium]